MKKLLLLPMLLITACRTQPTPNITTEKPLTESIFYAMIGLDDIKYCDYLIDSQADECKIEYDDYKLSFETGTLKIVDNNSRFTNEVGMIDFTIYHPNHSFTDWEVLGRFYIEITKLNNKYEWNDVSFDY